MDANDQTLRRSLIRLASQHPELRGQILPLLKEAAPKKETPKELMIRWNETKTSLGQAEAKVTDLKALTDTVARIKKMAPAELAPDLREKMQDAAWKGEKLAGEISELMGAFARKLRDF